MGDGGNIRGGGINRPTIVISDNPDVNKDEDTSIQPSSTPPVDQDRDIVVDGQQATDGAQGSTGTGATDGAGDDVIIIVGGGNRTSSAPSSDKDAIDVPGTTGGSTTGTGEIVTQEQTAEEAIRAEMPVMTQVSAEDGGVACLAMALQRYGIPADVSTIRPYVLPWLEEGVGLSPSEMVNYAKSMSLQAQQYSGAELEDISTHIREGRMVSVMLNYDHPDNIGQRETYVNVVGIVRNGEGDITAIKVQTPWGNEEEIAADRFMDMWKDVRIVRETPEDGSFFDKIGYGLGMAFPTYDRTMVVFDDPESERLPRGSIIGALDTKPTDVVVNGLDDLAGGVRSIGKGHLGPGMGQVAGGLINTVSGTACYVVGSLIGKNIELGGDALLAKGTEMLQEDGALTKVGGALVAFFGAIIKAIGWLLSMMAGVVSYATSWVGDIFSRSADKFNMRYATRDQLLYENPENGQKPGVDVLKNASFATKQQLLENLLTSYGSPKTEDQQAALMVLRAAKEDGELSALVAQVGGEDTLIDLFSGKEMEELVVLFNLASTTRPDTEPEPQPAG